MNPKEPIMRWHYGCTVSYTHLDVYKRQLLNILDRPQWWILLAFVPFINFIVGLVVAHDLAKAFGKGIGFSIGLALVSPIFIAILGFGDAVYQGRPSENYTRSR